MLTLLTAISCVRLFFFVLNVFSTRLVVNVITVMFLLAASFCFFTFGITGIINTLMQLTLLSFKTDHLLTVHHIVWKIWYCMFSKSVLSKHIDCLQPWYLFTANLCHTILPQTDSMITRILTLLCLVRPPTAQPEWNHFPQEVSWGKQKPALEVCEHVYNYWEHSEMRCHILILRLCVYLCGWWIGHGIRRCVCLRVFVWGLLGKDKLSESVCKRESDPSIIVTAMPPLPQKQKTHTVK